MKIKISLFLFLICMSILTSAQMKDYTYRRSLSQNTTTWQSIELPNDIYSKVKGDLSDIRIYGVTAQKDTNEAAYFIEVPKESVLHHLNAQIINRSKSKDGYSYTFKLNNIELVNEISLYFRQQNFDWKIRLEGTHDQKQWFTILDDYRILSILNEMTDYQFTTLQLNPSDYAYYRLTVKTQEEVDLTSAFLNEKIAETKEYHAYPIIWQKILEDKENKQTIIEFEIQYQVPISKITLFVNANYDYYRQVLWQYLSDSFKTETGWQYQYLSVDNGTLSSFEKNELESEDEVIAKRFKITIKNQDNLPLKIDSVKIEGCHKKLVVRCKDKAQYWLVYGNNNAVAPAYDISNFKSNIPKELIPLKIGDEEFNQKLNKVTDTSLFMNKNLLWAIMIIIILMLSGFSWKMIKNMNKDNSSQT